MTLELFPPGSTPPSSESYYDLARQFCEDTPYRNGPFGKRNWGGQVHSLCSYQGKLKPSIAHFLVSWFTNPGETVLDPMGGVGTIPLEARRMGRYAISNDLSPLAHCVSTAKLVHATTTEIDAAFGDISKAVDAGRLSPAGIDTYAGWGLNGTLADYFHPGTLAEVIAARNYLRNLEHRSTAMTIIESGLLHILHGNRPYALSRRSHPITPLKPTGEFEYRPVLAHLRRRLDRIGPALGELSLLRGAGVTHQTDFRQIPVSNIDAVITSPPFSKSLRFWSSNWLRLWFSGWEPEDFRTQPKNFLEVEQKKSFAPYREFALACYRYLRPGGRLIMHLGETPKVNMAEEITPLLAPEFEVIYVGRECVKNTESHGLTDKGATSAHWYLFAERVG